MDSRTSVRRQCQGTTGRTGRRKEPVRKSRSILTLLAVALAATFALGTGVAGASGGTGGGGSATGGGGTASGSGGTATGSGGTATGGGGTATGGGATGGGGGKVVCAPVGALSATAGYRPGAMGITVTYTLDPCISRSNVTISLTNLATGITEFRAVDPALNTASYDLPAFATAYRVDAVVADAKNGSVSQRASTSVTTPAAVANCATITKNNLTAGYWLTYAAIWESFTATDCGYGRERVELRITNLNTGTVVYDSAAWGLDGLLDYEGPVVAYDTPYQFDVEVHGVQGELLDRQSQAIQSAPLR